MGECGPTATVLRLAPASAGYSRWGNAGQLQLTCPPPRLTRCYSRWGNAGQLQLSACCLAPTRLL